MILSIALILVWIIRNYPDQVVALHNDALAIARKQADPSFEGACLVNLGNAYATAGDLERAIDLYTQALAIVRKLGDRRDECKSD